MADRVGQQLGKYRLINLLGKGGFAEVYLGEHLLLGHKVAVKVLQTQLTQEEADKFRIEASTLANWKHPHIVRVYDFDVEGDVSFFVMDYAPNGTLRQRHPRGTRLRPTLIVPYVKQIADALQHAHDRRTVHRDVKPENMLVGSANEVLLSDFGVATLVQNSQIRATQTIAGTVQYMAPEQILANPQAASDQYALAIVVYEWLTGVHPFQGSFSEVMTQQMHASPPPFSQKGAAISPAIEQIVFKALEKAPQKRFASVQDFAITLEQAIQGTPAPRRAPQPVNPNQPIRVGLPDSAPPSHHASPPTPPPSPHPAPPQPPPPSHPAFPPPTPPGTPLSGSLPALPKASSSSIYWPTFLIPVDERRGISSGKLPLEPLGISGSVLTTPSSVPLPVTTIHTPPRTTQLKNIVPPFVPPVGVPPIIKTPPGVAATGGVGGQLVRTSGSGQPPVPPPPPTPVAPRLGGNQVVRSTGSPTPIPRPQLTPASQATRYGVISLVAAILSIILFVATFTLNPTWAPWVIFIMAILGFSYGGGAIRKQGTIDKAKKLAGFGITLSVLATLVEIAWLIYLHIH